MRNLKIQALVFCGLLLALLNLQSILLTGIAGYQRWISPGLGHPCGYAQVRHAESCSAYAKRSVRENGVVRGMALSIERFQACGRLAEGKNP
jgi:putative component of membrane protein insertase Oxa1/YidC/SpoIIIJ protein YidD